MNVRDGKVVEMVDVLAVVSGIMISMLLVFGGARVILGQTEFWELIGGIWGVQDKLRDDMPPDLIAGLAYGVTEKGLTAGSRSTTEKIAELARRFPDAWVGFSTADSRLGGNSPEEERLKISLLVRAGISSSRIVHIGAIPNSYQETAGFRREFDMRGVDPKRILVVLDPSCARRLRRTWRKFSPHAEILMRCVPILAIVQKDQPVIPMRYPETWLGIGVVQYVIARIFGPEFMNRGHQPTKGAGSVLDMKIRK